jgi:hypothetical protein
MKQIAKLTGIIVILVFVLSGCSTEQADLQCVGFDFGELLQTRKKIQKGNSDEVKAYNDLIKEAGGYLLLDAEKVTDGDIPPTGNRHDFYAIGKYSWPNPDTLDGMPWIRIDCSINPEANGLRFDLARYNHTVDRVKCLSLAWFYSQDEKYAAKAAQILRVWFINEETKMNPNFECASALPGMHNGMAIGIIFGVTLIEMVDHVKLLTLSESWSEEDNNELKKWFSGYVDWLLTSEFGIKEKRAQNNHGTWYSAQVAAYSLYTGETEYVRDMIEFGKQQIDEQIAPDGSMPHELKRDWAFSYSVYGLKAFTTLALCGDHVGMDLWYYQTSDGRNLRQAYNFLIPYLSGQNEWQWGIVRENEKTDLQALPMMKWVTKKYKFSEYERVVTYLRSQYKRDLRYDWI